MAQWSRSWHLPLLAILVAVLESTGWPWDSVPTVNFIPSTIQTWSEERKLALREQTRSLWYHGFDNYMTHAFPMDELAPLSCSGQGPDWSNPANIASNDVAGNFSLTLVDVLDTFVVLNDRPGFEKAVRDVINHVSFDVNTKPQVFETTIRVLGGLLSGHIYANETGQLFHIPWYRGELLSLALDLGNRLLPAFSTPTGLPLARINLRHGLMRGETVESCTAGAGSLILEFGTLSRLTGDSRFEKAASKAFFAIWNRKSDIGLVGNTINTWTGDWTHPEVAGIGAGIDSFYEYALKWYIMSGEIEFLDVWDDAYANIMRYAKTTDGFWYRTVNMKSGDVAYYTIDSLSAFWPGLQVLGGDIQNAIKLHMMYYNLWRQHSGLPEVYDTNYKLATSHQYPLRPEFVESTWYLYRATHDPFYLEVGERILFDLVTRTKVACGLCGIQDLRTNKRDDRMESFALSETLKYLFLLFDEENPIHSDDSNYVFTTEGHILKLDNKHLKPMSPSRKKMRGIDNHQCPAYQLSNVHRVTQWGEGDVGLAMGIRSRGDVDFSRELIALSPSDTDKSHWSPDGWCEKPKGDLFTYDFILSSQGRGVAEDLSPSLLKLSPTDSGYIIHNVTGIRIHIVQRLDGLGYDVRKLGHYNVRPGQTVYVNDSALFSGPTDGESAVREPVVQLRFFVEEVDPLLTLSHRMEDVVTDLFVPGFTCLFGVDVSEDPHSRADQAPLRFTQDSGVSVYQDLNNTLGCDVYQQSYEDVILLVDRGECTFLQKLVNAQAAGAAGVLVITEDNIGVNPTADISELAAAGNLSDVAMVVLAKDAGDLVKEMVTLTEQNGLGQLKMAVEPEQRTLVTDTDTKESELRDPNRILYLNGHPLLNTRILV